MKYLNVENILLSFCYLKKKLAMLGWNTENIAAKCIKK